MSLFPPQRLRVWLGSGEDYCNLHTLPDGFFPNTFPSLSLFVIALVAAGCSLFLIALLQQLGGQAPCEGDSDLKLAHFGVPVFENLYLIFGK